jgi:dienelactone hydrolase
MSEISAIHSLTPLASSGAPTTYPALPIKSGSEDIRALYFEGMPYRGKPTRVFAWMGIPREAEAAPVPGIVLVHGGLGTAFEEWVGHWVERGYAAIAIDTCGALPVPRDANPRPRHEHAGPSGWGGFGQINEPVGDQWTYHAVAAILRAHALLRAQDGVDPDRIGITGISWGGFLTCIAAARDPGFAFAAPVYGCGYLDRTVFGNHLLKDAGASADRWLALWDPANHLPAAQMPMLWINGTNDAFFFPPPWQDSHRLIPEANRTMALIPMLNHSQETGSTLREVEVFADSITRGGRPLPRIQSASLAGRSFHVSFEGAIERAEIVWTNDSTPWPQRQWHILPVVLSQGDVLADLPPDATFAFLNLIDDRGCTVSSEIFHLPACSIAVESNTVTATD